MRQFLSCSKSGLEVRTTRKTTKTKNTEASSGKETAIKAGEGEEGGEGGEGEGEASEPWPRSFRVTLSLKVIPLPVDAPSFQV